MKEKKKIKQMSKYAKIINPENVSLSLQPVIKPAY